VTDSQRDNLRINQILQKNSRINDKTAQIERKNVIHCKKEYLRDPGGAKNNTVERAQYEKELEEAGREAAEEAERESVVSGREKEKV